MTEALYLSGTELEGLATVPELVDAVREGYRRRGEAAAVTPVETAAAAVEGADAVITMWKPTTGESAMIRQNRTIGNPTSQPDHGRDRHPSDNGADEVAEDNTCVQYR